MNKSQIYLLRHGEVDRHYAGRYVGQIDATLSGKGVEQARYWRHQLDVSSFGSIYSSDLTRSRKTAEIIAADSLQSVKIIPSLREISLGEWDGVSIDEIRTRFPIQWQERGNDMEGYRPPGGESFADLATRVIPAFRTIMDQVEQGPALIVGHAGVNRVILCHVLGMSLSNITRISQDYGNLNIIDFDRGFLKLKLMNFEPT
jgi:alpha-ribazole phosphatase